MNAMFTLLEILLFTVVPKQGTWILPLSQKIFIITVFARVMSVPAYFAHPNF
jgi:hypothetical protein